MGTNRLERVARKCLFAFMILLTTASAVQAGDTYWQLPPPATGDWFEPSNWTAGLPIGYAFIDNGGTATVSSGNAIPSYLYAGYDNAGTVIQTGGTMNVSSKLRLGCHSGSEGTYELTDTGDFTAKEGYIGMYGDGQFTQSGGSASFGSALWLGCYGSGASGTYELQAGDLCVGWKEFIGYEGVALFRQTGGTHTVGEEIAISTYYGANGTYELHEGELLTARLDILGYYGGQATFRQVGGTTTVTGPLRLGGADQSSSQYLLEGGDLNVHEIRLRSAPCTFLQTGGTNAVENLIVTLGTYDLRDGLLSGNKEWIGYDSTGSFVQSGGTNTAGYLAVKSSSSYEISGGVLEIGDSGKIKGVLDFAGGAGTLRITGGIMNCSFGSVQNAAAATLETAAGTLVIFPEGFDPNAEFGTVIKGGLLHTVGNALLVSEGEGVTGGGIIDDPVRCEGTIRMVRFPAEPWSTSLSSSFLYGGVTVANGGSVNIEGLVSFLEGASGGIEATGGSITASSMYLGDRGSSFGKPGPGYFVQAGGVVQTSWLQVNSDDSGESTYELQDGQLESERLFIRSNGRFVQTGGGTIVDGYALEVTGSEAMYELQDGNITFDFETLGYRGDGVFTQTGGTNTVNSTLGLAYSNGRGTYGLSEGQLVADIEKIGFSGEGIFTQTGGSNVVSNSLFLGYYSRGNGTYTISGGSLVTADLLVAQNVNPDYEAGAGTLNIADSAARITVSNKLQFGPLANLLAVPGATINMTGSAFENESTDPAALAGLRNLRLIFEGGTVDVDPFEVAGEDKGAVMAGLEGNFALGTLQLGGDAGVGQVQLVNNSDNRPDWVGTEALYVENLILGAGSTLDLAGLNLYYLTFTNYGGTILNGTPTEIPEPATLSLLALGACLPLLRRRR